MNLLYRQEMDITLEDHAFANETASNINKALENSDLKSRFNTNVFNNRYLGQLGEKLFDRWLTHNKISHDWQAQVLGKSDDYDFLVAGKKWDVKTNQRKEPIQFLNKTFRLMLLTQQIGLHADYYFWILVLGPDVQLANKAMLMGGLAAEHLQIFDQVEKVPGIKATWVPIGAVMPPLLCLTHMRREQ